MAAEIDIAGVRARIWDIYAANGVSLERVAWRRGWIPTPGVPGLWLDPIHRVFYVDVGAVGEAVAAAMLG